MSDLKVRGITTKQNDYGEGNRIISIFAAGHGIIKAVAYGAERAKSSYAASSSIFTYGDFTLKSGRGDLFTLGECDAIEAFSPMKNDIIKLSLCVYFSDITYNMLGPENPDDALLRTFLNTVYALSYRDVSDETVKMVYEMRLMCAEGYKPDLTIPIGTDPKIGFYFDVHTGKITDRAGSDRFKLTEEAYAIMQHVTNCDDRKMLSFSADDTSVSLLGRISERYLLYQLDHKFSSLDYYNSLLP